MPDNVTFKMVHADKSLYEKDGFRYMLLHVLLTMAVTYAMTVCIKIHFLFSVLVIFTVGLFARDFFRKWHGDFAKKKDIIGEITFHEDFIAWAHGAGKNSIKAEELHTILLKYNYIQGEPYALHDILHKGLQEIKTELGMLN